jgi:ParB-like chromosome segregation protein Spo0J
MHASSETHDLPLCRLRRESRLWPRQKLAAIQVTELAEIYRHNGPGAIEPLLVAPADAAGQHLVIDGWHRIEAALDAGLSWLPATVRAVAGEPEIYELAVRLSSRGPRRMTREEKRIAVDRLLRAHPQRAVLSIAEIAGVSHPFVAKRRLLLDQPVPAAEGTKPHRPDRCAASLLKWALMLGQIGDPQDEALPALYLARVAARIHGRDAATRLARLEAWAREARTRLEVPMPEK